MTGPSLRLAQSGDEDSLSGLVLINIDQRREQMREQFVAARAEEGIFLPYWILPNPSLERTRTVDSEEKSS